MRGRVDGVGPGRPTRAEAGAAVAAGLLAGLFGVGGGIVLVPLLVFVAGRGQREAQLLSLAAIVPISALGAASYALVGKVDLPVAAVLAAGGMLGVHWGTGVMARVSERDLRTLFGVVTLVAAGALMFL